MVLLQHRLSLKVSQRQILTPGLVQMVSVLALNKLELKDMINSEMVENPVLEELEDPVPLIDDVGRREEERERPAAEESPVAAAEKKDPFEEIDFGSFFQEYLDPGYRSQGEMEEIERPSFENFLSKPSNLTDYLMWQLGSINTTPEVREAAELVIGNLNEDGYLIATDEELMAAASGQRVDSPLAVAETEEEEGVRKKAERKERATVARGEVDEATARIEIGANYPFLKSYRPNEPIGMEADHVASPLALSQSEAQPVMSGAIAVESEPEEALPTNAPPDATHLQDEAP